MTKDPSIAVIQRCITDGFHLTSCDNDGYCNFCGNQEGWDYENNRWLPEFVAGGITLNFPLPMQTAARILQLIGEMHPEVNMNASVAINDEAGEQTGLFIPIPVDPTLVDIKTGDN